MGSEHDPTIYIPDITILGYWHENGIIDFDVCQSSELTLSSMSMVYSLHKSITIMLGGYQSIFTTWSHYTYNLLNWIYETLGSIKLQEKIFMYAIIDQVHKQENTKVKGKSGVIGS